MRLIDGDRLEDVIEDECFSFSGESDFNAGIQNGLLIARDFVQEAPTIDAEPIRHGMWKRVTAYEGGDFHFYECSICGEPWWFKMNYCAKCGARMDEDEISNIAKESADKISKALDKVRAKGMQKQNIKEDDEP